MKHAIIKSIGILLVELPKGATNVRVNKPMQSAPYFGINWDMPSEPGFKTSQGFALFYKDFGGKKHYPKDIQYLAPFEAMSEEMFSGLDLEKYYDSPPLFLYKDYRHNDCYDMITARESFLSAVEAEGFTFSNTAPHPSEINPTSRAHYDKLEKEWQQAQSRTFDSALTHIFRVL